MIGRYRIEGVLGRGAMGIIYQAHDPEIDRRVALKLIRADLLENDARADYLSRFRREAQAAGRCSHPNIVTIYDYALHDGNPFLAMEFVDGISLSQARERGTVYTPLDAAFIVGQVLDALVAAHAAGIVHRDIKPANIMLVDGSRVKVTDFGISRFDSAQMTQDGAVVGTPSYMSPEQCRGDAVDGRSDLFSTGAVLYELLCGQRPFAGRNFVEVMQKLLHETPPDIADLSIAVTPAVKAVVDRALAKQPADRFASARDMAAALRAAVSPDAAESQASDRTIFIPPAASVPAAIPPLAKSDPSGDSRSGKTGMTNVFAIDALTTLERRLAHYVGPIARYLVQNAMRNADTVEALCDTLASNIDQASARLAFREEALLQLRGALPHPETSPSASSMALAQDDVDRAQKALTQVLGPVARVLIKRTLPAATSSADFWQRLSLHIDRDADRQSFLKARRS